MNAFIARAWMILGIVASGAWVAEADDAAIITMQPADVNVSEGNTAVFQVVFESSSAPVASWYKVSVPDNLPIGPTDPGVDTGLTKNGRKPEYVATLSVQDVTLADAGAYYCRIHNASAEPVDSEKATLRFQGLMAHWTLDQNDLVDGRHLDRVTGRTVLPEGVPEFVAGPDGEPNTALAIGAASGWGRLEEPDGFDPTGGTGELTLCLWARGQADEPAAEPNLWTVFDANAPGLLPACAPQADERWHHFCAVFAARGAKLYLDGVPVVDEPHPVPSTAAILASVGLNLDGPGGFAGGLDDVRLYSQALSPSKIAALYEETMAAFEEVDPGAWGVHDPAIIKHAGSYYIFHTGRGISIKRSHDLRHWESLGRIFDELPAWVERAVPGVSSLWAPDVVFREGRYWVYYAASTFGSSFSSIGLVSNATLDPDDPDYVWVDEGRVISSDYNSDYNAIDGQIVEDDLGRWWLAFGSYWSGIKLTVLDPATGKPQADPPVLIAIAARPNTAIEAPFIIYRHGYYYLFVSFDACCQGAASTYNIRVGRAPSIIGRYVDRDGKLMSEGGGTLVLAGDDRWRGPGHNAILHEDGQDYLVYHAYDALNRGRSALRIRPIYWSTDLWPDVGTVMTAP